MEAIAYWIELSLEELEEHSRRGFDKKDPLEFYAFVLFSYLRGDSAALAEAAMHASANEANLPIWRPINTLTKLRYECRIRSISTLTLAETLGLAEEKSEWQGELFFVAALACDVLEREADSYQFYQKAAYYLEKISARRKALKARYNSLAALTCIEPERKLIMDHQRVYRLARKLGDDYLAGLTLLNISREFQRLSAHRSALKFVNRALTLLQKKSLGTVTYFLTLLHRADVLLDLDRAIEANYDIELASASEFPEVLAALRVLSERRTTLATWNYGQSLTPTWRERLEKRLDTPLHPQSLGALEDRLVNLISLAPRSKFELIENLWGQEIDLEFLESRLKSMVYRIRKKWPGSIVLSNGRYRLADDSLLQKMREPLLEPGASLAR